MSSDIKIIRTADGSHSLLNSDLNETYHSTHGAIRESNHVFIEKGLKYFLGGRPTGIKILEVGFGTALNALLTLDVAEERRVGIHFTTVDTFPLPLNVWSQLDYSSLTAFRNFDSIHSCSWNESHQITTNFHLLKISQPIQETLLEGNNFDIVYFDAFAPNKQPEMWTPSILKKMYDALKPAGVFVTYCAKGQVKRDLKAIGFHVETLEGPPGKKEMIRAIKR